VKEEGRRREMKRQGEREEVREKHQGEEEGHLVWVALLGFRV
jgi:hypothetical protein